MTSNELKGLQVIGAGGRTIGVVDEIDIDVASWKVVDIIVKVEAQAVAELGVQKPFWKRARMTIHAGDVQGTSDNLVLTIKLEDLARRVAAALPADESPEPPQLGAPGT